MSLDPTGLRTLPCSEKASESGDSSPALAASGPEENDSSSHMPTAEMLHRETASLPSSMDLAIQDSPDSSTSPRTELAAPSSKESPEKKEESKVQVKKQKIRTVFSQAQLCVLNERFQKQKYLSLQQMQELSSILNLTYKQVKTWFQNQRMKYKRWQKSNWPKSFNSKGSASTEYPDLHSNYPQAYLNPSGSLPVWSSQTWNNSAWTNQTWNNPSWNNQTWNNPSWSNHSWNSQTWYTQAWNGQAWNTQFHNFGEESLQPYMQFQPNISVSDLEASLGAAGESHKYVSNSQALDFLLNYSMNSTAGDV